MKTLIFSGTPTKLKEKLDALIEESNIINQVLPVKGGEYLIIYTS